MILRLFNAFIVLTFTLTESGSDKTELSSESSSITVDISLLRSMTARIHKTVNPHLFDAMPYPRHHQVDQSNRPLQLCQHHRRLPSRNLGDV